MKKWHSLYLLLAMATLSFAQSEDSLASETDTTQTYEIVEVIATFPGGTDSLNKYIMRNLRYPEVALENCIQGTVIASFIVERDGSISNIEILKSIGGGCEEEVIRIVSSMPKWTPGYQRGVPVRVKMKMPLKFRMSGCDQLKLVFTDKGQQVINERFPTGTNGLHNFFVTQGIFSNLSDYVSSKSPALITLSIAPDGKYTISEVTVPYCSKCDKEIVKDLKKMPVWRATSASAPISVSFQIVPEVK